MNDSNSIFPEDYIPKFRRKKLNEPGFLHKLGRFAGRLGAPVVRRLYALYFLWKSPHTPKQAKMIILGALVYFFSPIEAIPDLLGPVGFTDDIAVIALVYRQMKSYLTEDIREQARIATDKILGKK
ncbi:YkvA family protein [Neisseria iguanae]|uniref:DNA-binding protein n=1 Tax=Neisseria iguanae TaxID=90242 RepID=A0A2P7U0F3_9NEIS|nr:YkvA family protein [Neisseria iguanae]PSJ80460.1 DNA-binding protein [Neisseria iguanae]